MRAAVIVSTARTPIGKAYRGGFNNLASPTLAGNAISAAVARAGFKEAATTAAFTSVASVCTESSERPLGYLLVT